jgi:hypothetical protein
MCFFAIPCSFFSAVKKTSKKCFDDELLGAALKSYSSGKWGASHLAVQSCQNHCKNQVSN